MGFVRTASQFLFWHYQPPSLRDWNQTALCGSHCYLPHILPAVCLRWPPSFPATIRLLVVPRSPCRQCALSILQLRLARNTKPHVAKIQLWVCAPLRKECTSASSLPPKVEETGKQAPMHSQDQARAFPIIYSHASQLGDTFWEIHHRWFHHCEIIENTHINLDGVAHCSRLQACTVHYCPKQHEIEWSTRKNDAIRHGNHDIPEATATLTQHTLYSKCFLVSTKCTL